MHILSDNMYHKSIVNFYHHYQISILYPETIEFAESSLLVLNCGYLFCPCTIETDLLAFYSALLNST